VSVVLPATTRGPHRRRRARVSAALGRMPLRHEIVLVPNGSRDATEPSARSSRRRCRRPQRADASGGWGRAVRHGLAQRAGDSSATRTRRARAGELTLTILYAAVHPARS
jgi:hypothetical protein